MKKSILQIFLALFTAVVVCLFNLQIGSAQSDISDIPFVKKGEIESVIANPDSHYIDLADVLGEEKLAKMSVQELANLTGEDLERMGKENPESSLKEFLLAQNRPIHLVNPSRTPEIWRNTNDAFSAGKPRTLTYMNDPAAARRNRDAACRNFRPVPPLRTSCDEYPFASTFEGGAGATIRAVSPTEQSRQGGDLNNVYRQLDYRRGGQFDVYLLFFTR